MSKIQKSNFKKFKIHNLKLLRHSQNKQFIYFARVIIIFIFALTILAGMVKLVDMPDLGSGAARRVGSSPITRTKASQFREAFFILLIS